jgi:predicted DNA-binding protein (MmcQ/YjbR family)
MASDAHEAEELFEQLAERLLADPEVSRGTGFGSAPGLRVGSKIFAMLGGTGERLVVKLPRQRVEQLVAAGTGERFDPRHDGRLMKRSG